MADIVEIQCCGGMGVVERVHKNEENWVHSKVQKALQGMEVGREDDSL